MNNDKLLDLVKLSSTLLDITEVRKTKIPYRIKIDGLYLITCSNKTLWFGLNSAKNALHCHLDHFHNLSIPYRAKDRKEMIDGWIKSGRLVFEIQEPTK